MSDNTNQLGSSSLHILIFCSSSQIKQGVRNTVVASRGIEGNLLREADMDAKTDLDWEADLEWETDLEWEADFYGRLRSRSLSVGESSETYFLAELCSPDSSE